MLSSPVVTGSGIERFIACPASTVLPKAETSSSYADAGRRIHTFLERRLMTVPEEKALHGVPSALHDRCKAIDLNAILDGLDLVRPEVAYAMHLPSFASRELGRLPSHRAYDVGPDEAACTVDFVAVNRDVMPVVCDWKTGHVPVSACAENGQMLFAAACLRTIYDAPEIDARIVYIREDGSHEVDRHIFDALTLDGWLASLQSAFERSTRLRLEMAEGRIPDVRLGSHCTYCPSVSACPGHTALARAMLPELETLAHAIATLSPEQAGRVYEKKKHMRAILDAVDDGLRAYASLSPIPLENGKELRMVDMTRSSVKQDKLVALATRLGATEDELSACKDTMKMKVLREAKREKP